MSIVLEDDENTFLSVRIYAMDDLKARRRVSKFRYLRLQVASVVDIQ